MDYWEFSINFQDDNPHGNDKRRTPFRFAIIVTACFPALLLRQPTNQNLRPGCNSCQPEIIEMAEEPHPAWDLGACAKGQT